MAETVSSTQARRRLRQILDLVAARRQEFIIERKGKPVAALVSVERLAQMQRFARRRAIRSMEAQEGSAISDREAGELALEAQRAARRVSAAPTDGRMERIESRRSN